MTSVRPGEAWRRMPIPPEQVEDVLLAGRQCIRWVVRASWSGREWIPAEALPERAEWWSPIGERA